MRELGKGFPGSIILTLLMSVMFFWQACFAAVSESMESDLSWLDDYAQNEESIENTSSYHDLEGRVMMDYFALFFGPSFQNPTGYQPTSLGTPDLERPVVLKNFFSVGYAFSEKVMLAGTAYWTWQPVMQDQQLAFQDPFLRVSHNSIIRSGRFNLYGDFRVHLPVSTLSRENNLLLGMQTFQALTYDIGETRLTAGLYASQRVNFFGSGGFGNDLELYLTPNLNYQVSPTVALTLFYEVQRSHFFGDRAGYLKNDGSDIQPGVSWDITHRLNIHPFLNFLVGGKTNLQTTSFGMMLNWIML